MKIIKIISIIVFVFSILTGCSTIAKQNVEDMQEASQSFDAVMTEFIEVWPYISGAIDGAMEGRTFTVSSGVLELKNQIDQIVEDVNIGKYEKGKIATLWTSLVSHEILRLIREFRPDILRLIPAALLAL